jgi:hypothetical protein
MANYEIKFFDIQDSSKWIKTGFSNNDKDKFISIYGRDYNGIFEIWLDKSTAIKFAKTLRTEINKITESEVNNV